MHHSGSSAKFPSEPLQFYHFSKKYRIDDDNFFTFTSVEQVKYFRLVSAFDCIYKIHFSVGLRNWFPTLLRDSHGLDASRTWTLYWILHSLDLLDEPLTAEMAVRAVRFIRCCQSPVGGYGGGPGQMAHLATTYASVMVLCIVGTKEAYDSIDRAKLYSFLKSMKQTDGGFSMHEGGEVDIRGAYCAAAVAKMTNIMTPELFDKTAEWIISCQTYEGGFSAVPDCEAHGGYTFCGIAGLLLLGREQLCHTKSLLKWLANRQMRFEGGFNGRTNKLVDGCYSFWQAACFPAMHKMFIKDDPKKYASLQWIFDSQALQNYILICCQYPLGGLIDKPGKNRDYYHTCYNLSGLSIAQHFDMEGNVASFVVGSDSNKLVENDAIYNITLRRSKEAQCYFETLSLPS
ncbi:unnamed protein product [Soboliphyme baturini]|uniref:Protein farnesyltransferase subunit beta n=1 Tax=Soboliphyme baturini TaxID=241478 RepID=A0A183IQ93_9BILA|nr:unnamed protein product [Soboliphyme baturini]